MCGYHVGWLRTLWLGLAWPQLSSMQRDKGTEVRDRPGRPRPAPPKTSKRARTPYWPPSSQPSAPPFWRRLSSTCGVFTHVTLRPAPQASAPIRPLPCPRPTSAAAARRRANAQRFFNRAKRRWLTGQAGLWASSWLPRAPRGGGTGRARAGPSVSTGSREGVAWAGLKRAGRERWGPAHAQAHRALLLLDLLSPRS